MIERKYRHAQDLETIEATLATDLTRGLDPAEAKRRLARHGRNELRKKRGSSPWLLFAAQFKSLVIWVLIVAAGISVGLGESADGIAIITIVFLNAIVGFIQEFRAEKAAAALGRLAAPHCRVLRGGAATLIDAAQAVPGDILLLEAGDLVAADARLVEVSVLRVNEAPLTGESQPVTKLVATLIPATALAERSNMVFLGTSVVGGTARAVVVDTAMETELGAIARLLETAQSGQTPLQRRLDRLARQLVWASFGIVALIFLLGLLRGIPLFELFLNAVSLAVAAIPEGLPAVVTVALALGVQRMALRNALVKRMPSVETLGCAQVVCTDKTGTLTVGQMTVRKILTPGSLFRVSGEGYSLQGNFFRGREECRTESEPELFALLEAATACNDAELTYNNDRPGIVGDPTEAALLVAAAKGGITRAGVESEMPRVAVLPFDSERKRMTVIRRQDGDPWAFVKGAPEILIERCAWIRSGKTIRPINPEDKSKLEQACAWMAHDALRVLAVAERRLDQTMLKSADLSQRSNHENSCSDPARSIETDLVFLGLFGLLDPPRAEAKDAVMKSKQAGIKTVMITGDHPDTAWAIALELGIVQKGDQLMGGSEIESLDDEELRTRVPHCAVYARVTAEHKLRIVRAWKTWGAVVAMTGDGVNDAPALKEASIGVAMGITGTEVTKEAADIIITDDNFASIVAAVEEGRGIFDNIGKTLAYLLAGNAGELMVMLVAAIAGWPLPLLPLHLLWINLVTDGLPALALATDPVDPNVLKRAPRRSDSELLDREFMLRTLFTGILTAAVALGVFVWEFQVRNDLDQARDAAFTALVIAELLRAFGARSAELTVWQLGVFSNTRLFLVVTVSFTLQIAIHHVPLLQSWFQFEPLTMDQCITWIAVGFIPLVVLEIWKVVQQWSGRNRAPDRGAKLANSRK